MIRDNLKPFSEVIEKMSKSMVKNARMVMKYFESTDFDMNSGINKYALKFLLSSAIYSLYCPVKVAEMCEPFQMDQNVTVKVVRIMSDHRIDAVELKKLLLADWIAVVRVTIGQVTKVVHFFFTIGYASYVAKRASSGKYNRIALAKESKKFDGSALNVAKEHPGVDGHWTDLANERDEVVKYYDSDEIIIGASILGLFRNLFAVLSRRCKYKRILYDMPS